MTIPLPNLEEDFGSFGQIDRNSETRLLSPSLTQFMKIRDKGTYLPPRAVYSLITSHDHDFEQILLADVRYDSEYRKQHIRGASQLKTFADVQGILEKAEKYKSKFCVILYSQFSEIRASIIYNLIRSIDRNRSIKTNTNLLLTDLYILEGGYTSFSQEYGHLCTELQAECQTSNLKSESRNWFNEFGSNHTFQSFISTPFECSSLYCDCIENKKFNTMSPTKITSFNMSKPSFIPI